MKFASYGECDSLLKNIKDQESIKEEITFRKSLDDFSCKLLLNPRKKSTIKTETLEKKEKNQKPEKGLLRNTQFNFPKISFHEKVLNKIKLNQKKILQKTHKQTFIVNEEKVNKKLQKQMLEIQAKYSQKNEENKCGSSYYTTITSFKKFKRDEIQLERDNIDQILTETSRSKFFEDKLPLTSRRLNHFSLEPDIWTPRSDIN